MVVSAKDAAKPQPRVAMVAGASGLTGSALLRRLLADDSFTRVLALSRRPLPVEHGRLANRILKFEELERVLKGQRCTDAFCALGAAGGPRAGEAQLRAVDLALVTSFARAAQAIGATRFIVISAAGANRAATAAFQRVKGEMESALRELKFDGLDILQPGTLYGARSSDGVGDTLRHGLLALTAPLLRRSKASDAIAAEQVAAAMVSVAKSPRRGAFTYAGDSLLALTAPPRRRT